LGRSDTTDHTRLGTGPDEQRHETGIRNHSSCHEHDAHAGQHSGGEDPIPPQLLARRFIGPKRQEWDGIAR